jgi:methyl-accepting chemotaxis protein
MPRETPATPLSRTRIAALMIGAMIAAVIIRTITRELGGEPIEASAIARSIAAGDLAVSIQTARGDRSSVLFAMKEMRDSLVKIVSEVRNATGTIAAASNEIASGNQDLSARTEHQASSVEETASSMEGQGRRSRVAGGDDHGIHQRVGQKDCRHHRCH